MEKKLITKKPSAVIAVENKMGLLAKKCFNVILYKTYPELESKYEFEIPEREFMDLLGLKTKNQKEMVKALKQLMSTIIKFNYFEKEKNRMWLEMSTILQWVILKDGILKFAYSELLQDKIITSEMYSRINLRIQRTFKSKFSLHLFELCNDYYNKDLKVSYTPRMEIETFRKFMMGDDQKYKEFKVFNRWVIKTAVREVNENTELMIKPIFTRVNRKVQTIQFKIRKKSENEIINTKQSHRKPKTKSLDDELTYEPFDPVRRSKAIEDARKASGLYPPLDS